MVARQAYLAAAQTFAGVLLQQLSQGISGLDGQRLRDPVPAHESSGLRIKSTLTVAPRGG